MKLGNTIALRDLDFQKLSNYIYERYGINLPLSKKTLLESRLQKHLLSLGMTSFKQYIQHICIEEESPDVIKMVNLVSTNKTHFFREAEHFSFIQNIVLPQLSKDKTKNIKIWSSASSTGEEVYSAAMAIEQFIEKNEVNLAYTLVGSDISTDVLNVARTAIYNEVSIKDLPIEERRKFFLKSKDSNVKKVRINKKLRDRVSFKRFNLIQDRYPAAESFDIIFCRNVLIYFDRETQVNVIRNLTKCLKLGGYLFLGHSESLMGIDLPLKQRIHTAYQKISMY
ncbi:CheR family methyltransferase [Fulvivirga ligni]|uniref:CheR family methyltransferase n=1 Tax=Fulvivirga ligni TaxID=2904246 RepID=UPI001F2D0E92|nr:protein-glutamate O-methyltransferase CheR [Fulvivirga ligni]UII20817.1 protein-glutamate O-methyltransferase CheR [Fulvivirga ligni]